MNRLSTTINLRDFRENTQKYADLVSEGRSFIVFRRSSPLFKISPVVSERITAYEGMGVVNELVEDPDYPHRLDLGRKGMDMGKFLKKLDRVAKEKRDGR